MKISVIIPTFNRSDLILKTLDSFVNQKFNQNDFEIIICDNNSKDDTSEVIKKYILKSSFPNIKYIFEIRQGVHYARNTSAKLALGEILYFTDDDMIADHKLLDEIKKSFLFDPRVGCVTGSVIPIWEKPVPRWILKNFNNQYLSLLKLDEEFIVSKSLKFVYSCNQAIKRDVFFKAEGFNPEYTFGKYKGDGETGLNIKIQKLNYLFVYNNKCLTKHIIPKYRYSVKYFSNRFANNAIANNYTRIRLNKTNRIKSSFFYLTGYHILYSFYQMFKFLYGIFKNKSLVSIKVFHVYFVYLFVGLKYIIRFFLSKTERDYVFKNDWLTNDNI